ncbi:MAG: hypothetical protein FJ110_11300 [Deltaproteobacteria bacterium]|nr:hypothetical protein [Deltaproteobacteria bacterium]
MVDLKVDVAGVTFKNPVLPAASELVFDGPSAKRIAEVGVGGIVTKTFTTSPEFRIRVRPYQFPLNHFDPAFKRSGSFYSLASPHVPEMNVVMENNVPEIAQVCKENKIPLVVSFYEKPHDLTSWKRVAKGFEKAGARILELNFSSPTMKGDLEKSLSSSFKIIAAVAKSSHIPFGIKISPMMEPLIDAVKGWKERGISFVTAHNAPSGIYIDVEAEVPYGAPAIGGYLIGRPFLPVSLARVVQILKNIEIPVIGVGGIFKGNDALQYLLCGSSLVQVGTAVYIEGTGVFKKINREITSWMRRKKYSSISEFRGKALKKIVPSAELKMKERFPYTLPPETPYRPKIDHKKCILCQTCCRCCFYEVLHLENGKIGVEEERCWSCGLCVGICPEKAITLVDKKTGKIIWKGQGLALSFS